MGESGDRKVVASAAICGAMCGCAFVLLKRVSKDITPLQECLLFDGLYNSSCDTQIQVIVSCHTLSLVVTSVA